jgi:hypothetical protein
MAKVRPSAETARSASVRSLPSDTTVRRRTVVLVARSNQETVRSRCTGRASATSLPLVVMSNQSNGPGGSGRSALVPAATSQAVNDPSCRSTMACLASGVSRSRNANVSPSERGPMSNEVVLPAATSRTMMLS